jgi:hypothetical protein
VLPGTCGVPVLRTETENKAPHRRCRRARGRCSSISPSAV